MTSHSNDDTEPDLYGSSDPAIKFEETEVPVLLKPNSKRSGKFRGSIWSLPPSGFSLYKRTFNDRFALFVESIGSFFKKSIDFCRVFVYNVYCKHKQHERIKIVKTKDNTKSTKKEEVKDNKSKWYQAEWIKATGRGIMGIGLFLLVASEILATAIVFIGTENEIVPKVIVIPIAFHAFITLVKVFITFTKGDK